jgi:uncharacterized protein (TIGR02996 family)
MDATGFVNALLDDPNDEATLLVLADWLEDQGDPRAELVRIQALLRTWEPDHRKREPLQRRQRELITQLRSEWLGALETYCTDWTLENTLSRVTIEVRRFVGKRFSARAESLLNQAWVKTVRLVGTMGPIDRLVHARGLAAVTALSLDGLNIEDTTLEALLQSPYLDRLRDLDLSNNRLTDRAVTLLLGSPVFERLRVLSLRNNHLTSAGALALLAARKQGRLRLGLHGNDCGRAAVEEWTSRLGEDEPRTSFGPLGMEFRLIPAGSFVMGSPDSESGRLFDEGPQRGVTLTRPFYLGVYPVTQQQYEWLTNSNPSTHNSANGGGPAYPVDSVRWEDAAAFCRRLSELPRERAARRVYRLPTEAEWEYACRCGAAPGDPFAYGLTLSSLQANFNGDNNYGVPASGPTLGRTSPVGSYGPTPWGLYDMHGNVWEWCADWFTEDAYDARNVIDPRGPKQGRDGFRVLRGGAYFDPGRYCRCAVRGRNDPQSNHDGLGFRVLLEVREK